MANENEPNPFLSIVEEHETEYRNEDLCVEGLPQTESPDFADKELSCAEIDDGPFELSPEQLGDAVRACDTSFEEPDCLCPEARIQFCRHSRVLLSQLREKEPNLKLSEYVDGAQFAEGPRHKTRKGGKPGVSDKGKGSGANPNYLRLTLDLRRREIRYRIHGLFVIAGAIETCNADVFAALEVEEGEIFSLFEKMLLEEGRVLLKNRKESDDYTWNEQEFRAERKLWEQVQKAFKSIEQTKMECLGDIGPDEPDEPIETSTTEIPVSEPNEDENIDFDGESPDSRRERLAAALFTLTAVSGVTMGIASYRYVGTLPDPGQLIRFPFVPRQRRRAGLVLLMGTASLATATALRHVNRRKWHKQYRLVDRGLGLSALGLAVVAGSIGARYAIIASNEWTAGLGREPIDRGLFDQSVEHGKIASSMIGTSLFLFSSGVTLLLGDFVVGMRQRGRRRK